MAASSNIDNIGSEIIDFRLKGTDEKIYRLSDFDEFKLLVIIFMCNHCPYVKAIIDRLVKFQETNRSRGVQLIGINSNDPVSYPEDSFENMKLFSEMHKINFPYLYDETQKTARAYGAVCTPDIFLYGMERILKYRGRFDDNWKDESAVTSKDLEKAVNLLLDGKEIDFTQIPSIGCSVKWKD
ncbi:MAG: thioredoxin family protein [Ignavibacteria bacterium]|nr:thioredoxin family protein [Ignavibacteria bacterium]